MPWTDGYRSHAIWVTFAKRHLSDGGLPPDLVLQVLESLTSASRFTEEIVAMIEPASDDLMSVIREAKSTDDPIDAEYMAAEKRGEDMFEWNRAGRVPKYRSDVMLTTSPVWDLVVQLNPSIEKALAVMFPPEWRNPQLAKSL